MVTETHVIGIGVLGLLVAAFVVTGALLAERRRFNPALVFLTLGAVALVLDATAVVLLVGP